MFDRPPKYWAPVTPSDTGDVLGSAAGTAVAGVGLYVQGGGTVRFDGDGGAAVTVTVPAAFPYVFGRIRRVYATGTTAPTVFALV